MKTPTTGLALLLLTAATALLALPATARARGSAGVIESVQRNTENQLKRIIEPLLERYCPEQCKLLNVASSVDIADPDDIAPGFDDMGSPAEQLLAPSSATIKILVGDRIGPENRAKLSDLIQQHLDSFDYPIKLDLRVTHFPQPIGSEAKVTELRERIARQFQSSLNEIFGNYCPNRCMLVDFSLQTALLSGEEAQTLTPGEYVQEGGVGVRVKEVSGTILMDETLTPEERNTVLEMAKLKTNPFRNVALSTRTMKFPNPTTYDEYGNVVSGPLAQGGGRGRGLASDKSEKSEKSEKKEENNTSNNTTTNTNATNSTNAASTTELKTNTTNTTNAQTQQQNATTTTANNTSQNTNSTSDTNNRQERFERIEKIERVESGDAVQAELKKFQLYSLIFGCSVLSLLLFIAMATLRRSKDSPAVSQIQRIFETHPEYPGAAAIAATPVGPATNESKVAALSKRIEAERLMEELTAIFAQHPKVAKHVFSRILNEEGIETTAQYIHLFGEGIVVDLLRDASLQSSLNELMEYYAKTPIELDDDTRLELLRSLNSRVTAGKLAVMGNRSSNLFDFLAEMDAMQIMELIRNESLTVKAIVMTQSDLQKRSKIYSSLDEETRMKILTELSRIDYLPRDYIFNVSHALKRKRRENPRLNTEAMPGSEVLVTLLERTGLDIQRSVLKNLEIANPDSAMTVKAKLVSIDTLRYLRDSQLLEMILSLKHDELLQFLKGCPPLVKSVIFQKSPSELVSELEDELKHLNTVSREAYHTVERKVLNRLKVMANDGLINLIETNERMFADASGDTMGFIQAGPATNGPPPGSTSPGAARRAS